MSSHMIRWQRLVSSDNKQVNVTFNSGMVEGNPRYDRRRCDRSDQKTPWRHFSSVDVAARKYRIYPEEKMFYTRRPADFP
jgi:hypothetical protein